MKKLILIWFSGLFMFAALSGMFWILGVMAHLKYSFPFALFVVGVYITTIICIAIPLAGYAFNSSAFSKPKA